MQETNETEHDAGQPIPRRHELVIAAAIAAVFGDRAVVHRIDEVPDTEHAAWTRRGRTVVHGNHNLSGINRSMPDRGAR